MEEIKFLKANDFVLLNTNKNDYFVLRVIDARDPVTIDYYPQTEINGFLPLNAFGSPAVSGRFNSYVVDSEQFGMEDFVNINNIFDANTMGYDKENILLEIGVGISPSPLRLFRYFPSQTPLGNYLTGKQIHWGGRQQNYNIGYVDGFASPREHPTSAGLFYLPPFGTTLFTMMNPVSVPISPAFKFMINQMIVEPVADVQLAWKILNRIVPSKRAWITAFDSNDVGVEGEALYGVSAVSLNATTQDLERAGYGGVFQ